MLWANLYQFPPPLCDTDSFRRTQREKIHTPLQQRNQASPPLTVYRGIRKLLVAKRRYRGAGGTLRMGNRHGPDTTDQQRPWPPQKNAWSLQNLPAKTKTFPRYMLAAHSMSSLFFLPLSNSRWTFITKKRIHSTHAARTGAFQSAPLEKKPRTLYRAATGRERGETRDYSY